MRFRICSISLVMVLIVIWSCNIPSKLTKLSTQPNIVFILVDDLGYSDVGYLNQKPAIQTPNINRLAKNGVVFTEASL